MPSLTVYLDGKSHQSDVVVTEIEPHQLEGALRELKSLTHSDVEVSYFTALMKVLEKLKSADIDDALYEDVAKAINGYFYLYRYYKLPASAAIAASDAHLPSFAAAHRELPLNSESTAYHGLTRYKGSSAYLDSWIKEKQESIHPATLFTSRALKAQDKALRYLSYCADPFCSLLDHADGLRKEYAEVKTEAIRGYVHIAHERDCKKLCYIGFAGGLFGRDAFNLLELLNELEQLKQAVDELQLVFIDPEYTPLINSKHKKVLNFTDSVKAYLFEKALTELVTVIQSKTTATIHCHLFNRGAESLHFFNSMTALPKLFIGEDYFSRCGSVFGKDTAEEDMRALKSHLMKQASPLVSFQALKNDRDKKLTIEIDAPETKVLSQKLGDALKRS